MLCAMLFYLLLSLSSLSFVAKATLVRHDTTFTPTHILRVTKQLIPQACYLRESPVVNGTSPGPVVRLKPNETSWIRVYNDMQDENLTMHWHGLSQVVAPFSDGTPAASQWPIPPLHFFDYELHPEDTESGTYFYHSHVGFQANVVAGPLIVEDNEDSGPPYDYDDERVMFLHEYYHQTDSDIAAGLVADPFVWPGEALALLVNGGSPAAVNMSIAPETNENCGPQIIQVDPCRTYRFRFIGGSALSTVVLGFEQHSTLTVIGADGAYTQPADTDYVQVGSGQRFDMLLQTKTEAELEQLGKKNFWIQVEPRYRPSNLVSWACLSYDGAGCGTKIPAEKVLTIPDETQSYLEYELAPLIPDDFPGPEEVTRRVTISMEQLVVFPDQQGLRWNFDNDTWYENTPPAPWLVEIYKNGQAALPDIATALANDSYVYSADLYMADVGEVLEFVWLNEPNGRNGGFDAHPLHAHGSHFYDLGSGYGDYDADANNARLASQGHAPVRRDTTLIYKYTLGDDVPPTPSTEPYSTQAWRAWRLRVTNAGVWMIHCHTLQHMILGMQTVWVMGNASEITAKQLTVDVEGYLNFGGSVYGNASYDPFVNHYFD